MFDTTRNDLQKKSRAQLSALFNEVSAKLEALPPGSAQSAKAKSLLAMIEKEQAPQSHRP